MRIEKMPDTYLSSDHSLSRFFRRICKRWEKERSLGSTRSEEEEDEEEEQGSGGDGDGDGDGDSDDAGDDDECEDESWRSRR